jgi:Zn finger protein HypA/HybF involved in hydrogenase expression
MVTRTASADVPPPPEEATKVLHAATVDVDSHSPRGVPCEACATPVEPLDKFCPACGTPNPTYRSDVNAPTEVAKSKTSSAPPIDAQVIDAALQNRLTCQNCGATVQVEPGQRSVTCPFCDSNYVVEVRSEISGKQQPEFVIGFAITPQQAYEQYRNWLKQSAWFNPGDLTSKSVEDRLKGIYLPFWSFTMRADSVWQAQVGEHWYRTETYTETDKDGHTVTRTRQVQETEWWPLSGNHHRYYWGYLVSGSRGLPQSEALRVMPYQLPALKRYEPSYLSGWLSEEYSVEKEDALALSQQEFYRREQQNVGAFLPGDTHSQLSVKTQFSQISSDLCLLPIYILSYQYQGKLYRFLLNGQTGKMAGDKPVSGARIAMAIVGGLFLFALFVLAIAAISQR